MEKMSKAFYKIEAKKLLGNVTNERYEDEEVCQHRITSEKVVVSAGAIILDYGDDTWCKIFTPAPSRLNYSFNCPYLPRKFLKKNKSLWIGTIVDYDFSEDEDDIKTIYLTYLDGKKARIYLDNRNPEWIGITSNNPVKIENELVGNVIHASVEKKIVSTLILKEVDSYDELTLTYENKSKIKIISKGKYSTIVVKNGAIKGLVGRITSVKLTGDSKANYMLTYADGREVILSSEGEDHNSYIEVSDIDYEERIDKKPTGVESDKSNGSKSDKDSKIKEAVGSAIGEVDSVKIGNFLGG